MTRRPPRPRGRPSIAQARKPETPRKAVAAVSLKQSASVNLVALDGIAWPAIPALSLNGDTLMQRVQVRLRTRARGAAAPACPASSCLSFRLSQKRSFTCVCADAPLRPPVV